MSWFTTPFTRRLRYIEAYRFPKVLEEKLARAHPDWSSAQVREVLEALRDFFLACLHARKARDGILGMPSKAVDDAWHEFILVTRDYAEFCRSAFGRYLHHAPEGTMDVPMDVALAKTALNLRRVRKDGDRRLFSCGGGGCGASCGASCGSGCGGGCGSS